MKLLHHNNDYRQYKGTSTRVANNGRINSISLRRIFTSNSLLSFKLIAGFVFLALLGTIAILHLNNSTKAVPVNTSDLQIPAAAILPSSDDTTGTTDITPTSTVTQSNSSSPTQSSNDSNASMDVSISSNSNSSGDNSAQVSVNGKPVTVPSNGSTEHTSVVSSPDQTTTFTFSSDKNNNESSSGFSSSSMFVNSSTVSHEQEGE